MAVLLSARNTRMKKFLPLLTRLDNLRLTSNNVALQHNNKTLPHSDVGRGPMFRVKTLLVCNMNRW